MATENMPADTAITSLFSTVFRAEHFVIIWKNVGVLNRRQIASKPWLTAPICLSAFKRSLRNTLQ
jgi:hypothetical protein